jgi:hypothetical protein
MVRCRSSGLKPLEKQVQGNWFMMKFLKFAFTISSFSTPIFASMCEASMEASAKKKGRRGVHRDSSIFFYAYNNIWERYNAFQCIGKHRGNPNVSTKLGNQLWVICL